MVDEQTSGLNLGIACRGCLRNSRIMDQIVKQGRFVLAVALMASGAEQLICARSALPVRYSIPWAPGSQGLHPRILGPDHTPLWLTVRQNPLPVAHGLREREAR